MIYLCEVKGLKKIRSALSGKLYEVKKQYPIIRQFLRGMGTVEKELNKDVVRKK